MKYLVPGADPGFSLGGGGAKDYVARTHMTSAKPEVPCPRAPLPLPEDSNREPLG